MESSIRLEAGYCPPVCLMNQGGHSSPLNDFYFLLGIDIHRPCQQGNRVVNIQSFAHIKRLAGFHADQ